MVVEGDRIDGWGVNKRKPWDIRPPEYPTTNRRVISTGLRFGPSR